MKPMENAAVFRISYGKAQHSSSISAVRTVPATLQIATPLAATLGNGLISAEQTVIMAMNNLRIGSMLPFMGVSFHGTVEVLPLEIKAALQPIDQPVFIRDVMTVVEQLQYRLSIEELAKLRARLLAPRQLAYVYSYAIDDRFTSLDHTSEELFDLVLKQCHNRTVARPAMANMCVSTV
jgi:hypothetical protein